MNDKSRASRQQAPISLWKFIGIMIIFAFVVVALFGAFIYLFVGGALNSSLPTAVTITIFLAISAVFAWLLQRVSNAASEWSRIWFAEDTDEPD